MTFSSQEVADRLELRALVDEYGFAADARDAACFAAVFAPDGVLFVYALGNATEPIATYRGSAELETVVEAVLPHFGASFHLMANQSCRFEDGAASGEVYCLARHLRGDREPLRVEVMAIRYEDRYERLDGSWRIVSRHARRVWDERHEARLS